MCLSNPTEVSRSESAALLKQNTLLLSNIVEVENHFNPKQFKILFNFLERKNE